MKTLCLSLLLQISISLVCVGQSSNELFIGLLPDVTVEIKNNDQKAFSVNILPVVAQLYLSDYSSIRVSPVLNLERISKSFTNIGGQLGFPIYPFGESDQGIKGIYAAPLIGFSHNLLSSSNEITTAVEPGYSWILDKGFTMNLGLQMGGTFFTANDENGGWRNHTGVKFSLGYTFRTN